MTTDIPTSEQLVERASSLVPVLRKSAQWAEDHRRLSDEVIDALADAGIFRMRVPKRYGGYESDTATLVAVGTELGRGDGAAAWTSSVYWIPTWMVGHFPDPVQEEVFSTPNVRVCGTLSPGGMATPVSGGVRLNGKWAFMSGAHHAHWQEIVAIQAGPDSEPMPIVALVPMTDLQVVDDWFTAGLKGSGSVSTVANDVFIPAERILPLGAIIQGQGASVLNGDVAMYRSPLLPVASASSVGAAVGLARAAVEEFLERLPSRKITYTDYTEQKEAPLTHLQVAEAVTALDEAVFHAQRLSGLVDNKCAAGAEWTLEERVRARADLGAVCRRAKEAVDVLASASGGSSIYLDAPMQRIARDIGAINLHALMNPNTNAELFGRALCGLGPNTQYL
ncbi:acyl-CoA dehydrogenase family protein [Micromonospora sediminicola]|uniref:acyl-CoA dehydrogenase family protein n=1 Tax=Micromonospora sediminicola TaxID=946078 RepID=UPI0033D3FA6D